MTHFFHLISQCLNTLSSGDSGLCSKCLQYSRGKVLWQRCQWTLKHIGNLVTICCVLTCFPGYCQALHVPLRDFVVWYYLVFYGVPKEIYAAINACFLNALWELCKMIKKLMVGLSLEYKILFGWYRKVGQQFCEWLQEKYNQRKP